MTTARAVHIDTDPGLDDLLALATALASPEIEVVGITTVAGNAPLEVVTENTQRFLALCRVDLPLGRGAAHPRALAPVHAENVHGADGRRGVSLPAIDRRPLPPAGEILRQSLRRGARQVIALGPLTNLAELIAEDPAVLRGVEVVWMGGSLSGGNATPHAEFNCHADPKAAQEVLAGASVRLIGLDVTRDLRMRPDDFAEPAFGPGRVGRFLADVLHALMETERPLTGELAATLHDPAAVLAASCPNVFRYQDRRIEIRGDDGPERGRMCDPGGSDRGSTGRYAVEAHVTEILRRIRDRLSAWAQACE